MTASAIQYYKPLMDAWKIVYLIADSLEYEASLLKGKSWDNTMHFFLHIIPLRYPMISYLSDENKLKYDKS